MKFAIIYSSVVFIPGPGMMSIMAHATRLGKSQTSFFLAGFVIGELIWLGVALLGFDALLRAFPQILVPIKMLCALYLLKLSFDLLVNGISVNQGSAVAAQSESRARAFMTSLAITLSNPKVLTFYVGVLPSVIEATSVNTKQVVALMLTIVGVLTIANVTYLVIGEKLMSLAAKRQWDHDVAWIFASLLAVLSCSMVGEILW